MEITYRRSRYQAGSLKIEKRITGIEVYVFRWRQPLENGKSLQRKIVLGTVKELSKTQAQKKADVYRKEANTLRPVASETSQTVDTSLTVAELVGPPKTDSSRRPLPIPPQVLEALKARRGKSSYPGPEDWVFASDVSFGKQPYWPGTLWRGNVAPAIERAGIIKPNLG